MVRTHRSITLGSRRCTVELAGLRLVEASYPPGQRFAPHAHGSANVTLVLAGGFHERSATARVHARPTSLVIKPRGTVHANRYDGGETRSFLIEVAPGREADVGLDRFGRERWFEGGELVSEVLEVLRAAHAGEPDLERTVLERLRALLRRAAVEPANELPRSPSAAAKLRAAERQLDQLADPPGSVELARRVGLHPVHLARLFRRAHGRGIAAYRRKLQVREAARRLVETPDPAGQIALAAGFADQSHLCRAFKRELGISPGAYRRLTGAPWTARVPEAQELRSFKTAPRGSATLGA